MEDQRDLKSNLCRNMGFDHSTVVAVYFLVIPSFERDLFEGFGKCRPRRARKGVRRGKEDENEDRCRLLVLVPRDRCGEGKFWVGEDGMS